MIIDHEGVRYYFDPNRVFSKECVGNAVHAKPLKKKAKIDMALACEIAEQVGSELLEFTANYTAIIGLHNNTRGGKYSVTSYLRERSDEAQRVHIVSNKKSGSTLDDFFIVTNPAHFDRLKDKDEFHVVLTSDQDDGSLSSLCRKKGIPYINPEAAFGNVGIQRQMIAEIEDLLKT